MKEYVRGRYRWECPRCFLQMFEQDGESLGSFGERVYAHKDSHFDEDYHIIPRKNKAPLLACNYCSYTIPSLGRWTFVHPEDHKYHTYFIRTIGESTMYLNNHALYYHSRELAYMWEMSSHFHG